MSNGLAKQSDKQLIAVAIAGHRASCVSVGYLRLPVCHFPWIDAQRIKPQSAKRSDILPCALSHGRRWQEKSHHIPFQSFQHVKKPLINRESFYAGTVRRSALNSWHFSAFQARKVPWPTHSLHDFAWNPFILCWVCNYIVAWLRFISAPLLASSEPVQLLQQCP